MFRILNKTISIIFCLLFIQNVYSQTQNQFLKAAQKAYNTAMYDEAISYYQQALKFNENDQEIAYKIALCYYNLKDYSNANTFFEKVTNIESDALFNYYKAQNYKYLGDYNNAISHFEKFTTSYPIDGFYRKKAIQEIASCHWALAQKPNDKTIINHYKKPLNTAYSDFGANYIDSNTIQLTSLLPLKQDKNEYQSSLFFYQKDNDRFKELKSLKFTSEQDSFSYANGFYLKDKGEFYYNKCYTSHEDYEKTCDLFVRKFDGKNWQEETPLNFNTTDFTETQAHVFVNKNGETELYFISDRLGGKGKLDIWRTKEISYGNFTTPENVSEVNTIDNEATPFFNEKEQKLYFSSSWYYGFGGYDIFVSNFVKGKFEKPQNLGLPVNSSSDDMYYSPTAFNSALFSSNREGALSLKNAACCFDVYEHKMPEKTVSKDSLIAINNKETQNITERNTNQNTKKLLDKIQNQLPATVYFHNDEPNPKTTDTITKLSYLDAYNSYLVIKSEYFAQLKNKEEVNTWFNEVKNHYNELNSFLADIETLLKQKETVILLVEGYCSPLALNDYNINLAKRRIVSVENYILKWNNGVLQSYFNGGYLRFKNAPFGEEKADQNISDSTEEVEKSIYSTVASLERRASVVAVEVE